MVAFNGFLRSVGPKEDVTKETVCLFVMRLEFNAFLELLKRLLEVCDFIEKLSEHEVWLDIKRADFNALLQVFSTVFKTIKFIVDLANYVPSSCIILLL